MTIAEASAALGISVWLGRRLAKQGQLPGAFPIGGVWRVHRATFHAELERLAAGQPASAPGPDEVLERALGDVRMQLVRRRNLAD
jgi:excisionase family DNA binding protein